MNTSDNRMKKTPIEYCTSGKFISRTAPMIHQKRIIDSFVLLYGVSGSVFLSDTHNEYELSPNHYLILAANREHVGTKLSPPGVSYYWCHFYLHTEVLLSTAPDGSEWITFGEMPRFHFPLFGKCPDPSKMHVLFHQLIDSSRTGGEFTQRICGNFLEILLSELASLPNAHKVQPSKNSALIANVLEWVRINAAQIRGVKDVAAHFGYNSEYLTTVIRKQTGSSLIDHINEGRIQLAKELLRTTDQTMLSIALQCGFSDEKYFLRVFKKHCDIPPGRFRQTYAKLHTNNK
ncbi:MAG: helix-turn-helix transcriptional regulator [Clostridia bacterium]|nr:helix-turn-helix transcriptional regulator [Clostridia bacterium]